MCGGWRPICGGDGAVPLEEVSRMPGHFNTSVTFSTYARYLPEHMQDAVDILDFGSLRRGA
ncbi:hypothetical protein [Salipiger marinus]|uniref:hypothetical protein n=1 Tax=Salipiger marinus TaxID=555512 RepID=UPI0040595527